MSDAVIVGCGGWLGGDDAVGLLCLEEIERRGPPRGVRLVAAPGGGFSAWDAVRGARRAAIVDGMVGGGEPGAVRAFDLRELVGWWPAPGGGTGGAGGGGGAGGAAPRFGATSHDLSPLDGLRLGWLGEPDLFPAEVVVFGVEMVRWGRGIDGLTREVAAALPRLVEAVLGWAAARGEA